MNWNSGNKISESPGENIELNMEVEVEVVTAVGVTEGNTNLPCSMAGVIVGVVVKQVQTMTSYSIKLLLNLGIMSSYFVL